MEKQVLKIKTKLFSDGSFQTKFNKELSKLNPDVKHRVGEYYNTSTDTCGGVPMPAITEVGYTFICMDNVWVKVPVG